MLKIAHVRETNKLELPKEVVAVIKEIATILDSVYGEYRDVEGGDGGYILVLESAEDFSKLKDVYLDIDDLITEYVDRIAIEAGEDWLNALTICNNDYAISLVMSVSIAPKYLIEGMEAGEEL